MTEEGTGHVVNLEIRVDFDLLVEQKRNLAAMLYEGAKPDSETLEGLLALLDSVQDQAAERYGEKLVFGREFNKMLKKN